jgi:4-amino-4-deoxy-L-arabinose transferase-like glycosyltransferase
LAGLFCGLTAYTYLAARAFPIPLAVALLTLFVTDRSRRRARLGQLAIFVAVAALTLAPLAHHWLTHSGSFLTRTQQVAATSWAEAWAGVRACLKMFFLRGDPYIRFNLPHRPLFDPITAILFLIGIVTLILKLRPPISNLQSPVSNLPT